MGKKEPCFLKGCMALYYNNNRCLVCEEHPIKSLEIKWGLIKQHDVSKFCGDYHVVFALNESGVCFEDRHKALEL